MKVNKKMKHQGIRFSVIIPVDHRGIFLQKILSSLKKLDFPPHRFEVLVVGNGSDIESMETVKEEQKGADFDMRYIQCESRTRSQQHNAACAQAKGDVFVFTDDDCIIQPDWLKKFSAVLETHPQAGIVGGADKLAESGSAFDLSLDFVLNSPFVMGRLLKKNKKGLVKYYPKSFNMAVVRTAAEKAALGEADGMVQIFDQDLEVHEDVDLASRVETCGNQIVYAPEAKVGHFRNTNFLSFFKRNIKLAQACRKLKVHRLPQWILSGSLILACVLAVLSAVFPWARVVLGAFAGSYVLILVMSAVKGFFKTRKASSLFLVPLLTASLHLSRAIGYLLPTKP
ncbi:MAG: glycosyltransferase [Candidatus Aminicenantes bacterium]|nr:glycosyltransferase [Candidatus Aminicenantes bacterium]